MIRRILIALYGLLCYGATLLAFAWLAAFLIDVVVPVGVDGDPLLGFWPALLIDLGLVAMFGLQHSVMARPAFKRVWTRVIPPEAERSTYCLASSLALIVCFLAWQPLGIEVWSVGDPTLRALLYGLYAAGWGLLLASSFVINHFDLFGLRQVWLQLLGRPYRPLPFSVRGPYRFVRHPLYVAWLTIFWATPDMGLAHLAFALAMSGYILYAITLEERDLITEHGEAYARYRGSVGKLIPRLRPVPKVAAASEVEAA